MPTEEPEAVFAVPGFTDLDSDRLRFFFYAFAAVFRERPLGSFKECNELIGTPNGVASGAVRMAIADLSERGYLRPSVPDGVELTARGISAARAAGILQA